MALKPRLRPAAPAADTATDPAPVVSRERAAPPVDEDIDEEEDVTTDSAQDTDEGDEDQDMYQKAAAEMAAQKAAPDQAEAKKALESEYGTDETKKTTTQRAMRRTPTDATAAASPKERLIEIRRELKALNSEELAARKALDAEFGTRRKALRSEYDLLTRQETAILFGDEPDA